MHPNDVPLTEAELMQLSKADISPEVTWEELWELQKLARRAVVEIRAARASDPTKRAAHIAANGSRHCGDVGCKICNEPRGRELADRVLAAGGSEHPAEQVLAAQHARDAAIASGREMVSQVLGAVTQPEIEAVDPRIAERRAAAGFSTQKMQAAITRRRSAIEKPPPPSQSLIDAVWAAAFVRVLSDPVLQASPLDNFEHMLEMLDDAGPGRIDAASSAADGAVAALRKARR